MGGPLGAWLWPRPPRRGCVLGPESLVEWGCWSRSSLGRQRQGDLQVGVKGPGPKLKNWLCHLLSPGASDSPLWVSVSSSVKRR